jgi:uncharacterized DUF497 family protein
MKKFVWSDEKNEILKRDRGVSFEEVVVQIANGEILDVLEHPNPDKDPNQRVFVVRIQDYAFLVPFFETGEEILLMTIIPSRKATRDYLGGKRHE